MVRFTMKKIFVVEVGAGARSYNIIYMALGMLTFVCFENKIFLAHFTRGGGGGGGGGALLISLAIIFLNNDIFYILLQRYANEEVLETIRSTREHIQLLRSQLHENKNWADQQRFH